jgi:hypothetical protein
MTEATRSSAAPPLRQLEGGHEQRDKQEHDLHRGEAVATPKTRQLDQKVRNGSFAMRPAAHLFVSLVEEASIVSASSRSRSRLPDASGGALELC